MALSPKKVGMIGLGMFVFSLLLQTIILPTVVNMVVRRKVALKKGWFMRNIWDKFPFAAHLGFYFFNVTNPEGIQNGEKPILQQVGPWVYEQWQEKTNQVDRAEDDSILYTFRNTYFFDAERSKGLTGDEEIVVPHYFILGLVNIILRTKPSAVPIVGKAVDSVFRKPSSIFITVKVKDLLFDGVPIDCTVSDFAGSAICNELREQYVDFGMKLVAENQYLFSLWGMRNGTDAKLATRVLRGLKHIMDVGKVIEYGGKKNISTWDDEYCDTFNGTDGTVFHPYFDKTGKDDLVLFNSNLCRSVSCKFIGKSKTSGISTIRFTLDLGTDAENNPLHRCFCEAPDKCMKKGAYDAFKCLGLPLVVTNPHFYLADGWFLSKVEGIKPIKEKHMVIIDLDPFTGAPVEARARAQFNMFIMPVPKFKLMKNFPEALLPLFWIEEETILPKFLLKEIKFGLMLYALGKLSKNFMMFAGIIVMGAAGALHYRSYHIEKLKSIKMRSQNVTQLNAPNNNVEKKIPITIGSLHPAPLPASVD